MELNQEIEKICFTAITISRKLKSDNDWNCNPIDLSLPVVRPFIGNGRIKLIVLGQDPTIKIKDRREKINITLNLDKNNSLKSYVEVICSGLGLTLANVYATNLFKYFYTIPPAQTLEVMQSHLSPNLVLLQQELEQFSNIPIITLGEPVLRLLTHEKDKVREYWDYNPKTRVTNGAFKFSRANDNKLNRDFYPFPHQPSIRKEFYRATLVKYLEFVEKND